MKNYSKRVQEFENRMECMPNISSYISREQSITHVYSLPYLNIEDIIKNAEILNEYEFWKIKSNHLTGIYIESDIYSFLIYMPKKDSITLNYLHFNQSIDAILSNELKLCAEELDISHLKEHNFNTFLAILFSYSQALEHIFCLSKKELEQIKVLNSLKATNYYYKALVNNNKINLSADTHLKAFSWIYYVELKIIGDIYKDRDNIYLHDVATNTGNLPLLINNLSKYDLFNVNYNCIECSDIDNSWIINRLKMLESVDDINYSKIKILELDLLKNLSKIKNADVIIANDVLEHFEDTISFEIFKNLWQNTKKLLIIHVPIENQPYANYGHYTSFTKQKLFEWANELPECQNITEKYSFIIDNIDSKYYRDGFLCLYRNDEIS